MKKITIVLVSLIFSLLAFGGNHKEVTISGDDTMQFDIKSFNASKGTDFKLTSVSYTHLTLPTSR